MTDVKAAIERVRSANRPGHGIFLPADIEEICDFATAHIAEPKGEALDLFNHVVGWRESDWPAGFCRYTAELIADDLREFVGRQSREARPTAQPPADHAHLYGATGTCVTCGEMGPTTTGRAQLVEPYRCPVCGVRDPNAYLRCNRPDCTDGRDPR